MAFKRFNPTNRYAGNCLRCGSFVGVGAGFFEKANRKNDPRSPLHASVRGLWAVRCRKCVGRGHEKPNEQENGG